ncbi:MAG: ABC transporter substrate-binding protein [Rhodospirillaceae bacterium]
MLLRTVRICFVAVAVVFWAALPALAGADSASTLVKGFQGTLLEVMKSAETSDVRQRFARLAPQVDRTFHVPLMVQIATSDHWNSATAAEKADVVKAFRRMSVATLATLFDGYNGEVFAVAGERPGPSKTTIVKTVLTKSDKSTVDIAYVARPFGGEWRLIDVVVDNGISELKVRRSEYRSVLNKSGLPGLIALLNGKADELMSD